MKKSKSWIHICVRFLLFTLGVLSDSLDVNPVTDDISKLSILRENIPKDYKIPVRYVPKIESGMCWVKLNVFYLEESLQGLADKFGNVSSNRNDISIVIQILQELRLQMGSTLEDTMYDFQCHYRDERWHTKKYFDFAEDFLTAARNEKYRDIECDPPPCPTTPYTVPTEEYPQGSPTPSSKGPECSAGCTPYKDARLLPEVVERSLLSLLFIPLLALVFLLVWKVRSRRNEENLQQTAGEQGLFTGTEGTAPPLDAEISEKNKLNVIEIV